MRAAKIKRSIDLTFATKQKKRIEDPWRTMRVVHEISLNSATTVLLIMSTIEFSRHTQEERIATILMMNECHAHIVNRRVTTSGL